MPVIETDFKNKCVFCKKRPASKLCDKPIGTWYLFGHPRKKLGFITADGPMSGVSTCDNRMCNKCATTIDGMDICPKCAKKMKDFFKK